MEMAKDVRTSLQRNEKMEESVSRLCRKRRIIGYGYWGAISENSCQFSSMIYLSYNSICFKIKKS